MVITAVGWFGTETIGDRAILAGILHVFSLSTSDRIALRLGSLYTPLTERTLYEDIDFYKEITHGALESVTIFDSLSKSQIDTNIKGADVVIVSGGPLGDMNVMYMLKYAFKRAKKHGIRTSVYGCGWGPLHKSEFIKLSTELVEMSYISILRDSVSANEVLSRLNSARVIGAVDPAFFAAQYYRSHHRNASLEDKICVNFRELFVTEERCKGKFSTEDCINVVNSLLSLSPELPIHMIPMHTFTHGGDDRIILNKVAQAIDNRRIEVQNYPLNLKDTMTVYYDSRITVGMRFHAILLQTVLNGKNYVMDYMESTNGKISNLLSQLKLKDIYANRYVSCENIRNLSFSLDVEKTIISDDVIDDYKRQYIEATKYLIN